MTRRLRALSGVVLFAYVTTHLLNHALGLVSIAAMESGRAWFLVLWRNPLGTVLLYGALLTHVTLALVRLYGRRHLRMPAWEATQTALGLAIPVLLVPHIVGTRIAAVAFGVPDTYTRVLTVLWALSSANAGRQLLVITLAWVHGCVGLHYWLRLRRWYARAAAPALGVAVLVPVLAGLGFAEAGRQATALARDPARRQAMLWDGRAPLVDAEHATLVAIERGLLTVFPLGLGGVAAARAIRAAVQRRRGTIRLTYSGDRVIGVPLGFTVLEASRLARIPHAAVCGGRGRCSTCRVRVGGPAQVIPPPSEDEARLLRRLGLPHDVRLACQLRPTGDIAVMPLLPATATAADGRGASAPGGREQEVTVVFADLRGFTSVAEHRLPYDVVFLLNRYFEAVGGAIVRAGGLANQFTGDGVMALFGVDGDATDGARAAFQGAREIVRAVDALSRSLADDLPEPLRVGVGVHIGPAVVGTMGYGPSVCLTAVGDTVHVASRLEQLTKDHDCQLIVSDAVAARAGIDLGRFPAQDITLRNRRDPLTVRIVTDVEALPLDGDHSRERVGC